MKVDHLSFSSISTYEQCPWKYHKIYDGGEEGKAARMYAAATVEGSIVHDVLEFWHKDRNQDWKELLRATINKKKDEAQGTLLYELIKSNQFIGAHDLLAEYMKRDDIRPNILATEIPFKYILPNGVPVSGRIDRADDLGDGWIGFVDYKTSRSFIYRDDVEYSLQGMMYVIVGRHFLYPEAKGFKFTIDALRFTPITVEFPRQRIQGALDYLEGVYELIQKHENPVARPNKFCGYCQFRDECPAIKAMLESGVSFKDFEGHQSMSMDEMARNYLRLEELSKTVDKLKNSYGNSLIEHMNELDLVEFKNDELKVLNYKTQKGNPALKVEASKKIKEIE